MGELKKGTKVVFVYFLRRHFFIAKNLLLVLVYVTS